VTAEWDADGYRVARETSLGHQERVARNAYGGRIQTTIDDKTVMHHERDELGREVARALPEGGRVVKEYDAMSRLTRCAALRPSGPDEVSADEPEWIGQMPMHATHELSFRYGWDGELIGRADSQRGNTEYRYDPIGQLLAQTPEQAREHVFEYDLRGNRSETTPGAPIREFGAGNQVQRNGDVRYRWDALGRLIEKRQPAPDSESDAVWRYAWNSEGLLTSVEMPDGSSVQYIYDALSRRLAKRVLPAGDTAHEVKTVRFIWDGNHIAHDIREVARAAGDPVVEERTFGFDDSQFVPLYQTNVRRGSSTANTAYYLTDQVGSVDCLLDAAGEHVWTCNRTPWGESEEGGTGEASPFRLQGQYRDDETGLHYNRNRYYDPALGFFISADPLGLEAGHHDYRYAPNPLQWIDPLGLVTAALMASMEAEGREVPDGSTAHHIVQRNGGGDGGTRARTCLARAGIGIDDGANGARLKGTRGTQCDRGGHERGCEGYHGGNDIHGPAAMTRVADRLEARRCRGTRERAEGNG
jgi:RHS repeat-associated protein